MSENSINVKNVSKKFRLYHEKRTTMYESIIGSINRKPHYETLQVLDDISFNVKKGESFGIVGRNGSGKTTLLRILSKIYQPDSGSVETNGIVVPVLALGLGFHPDLTAITNIYQSSILLGISKKQIKEKIDDIIKFAELEKFADTKLKNFSSGMQMRLAFATAVQVDPAVLLLDEVIAVGDVNFQKKCLAVMQDFKKRGKSIVLVSHSSTSIKELCDRAMFLKDGSIETIGHPNDVIDSYETYMSKLEK
jgi:lipopolysaccharide transport system ATP-binding protein